MKTYITLLFAVAFTTLTFAQLETPDLSPAATIKQRVGLTDIEINYSRPSVKGRTIFGPEGLLPFGEFWRVGANAAIKFEISRDITFGDKPLGKGSYTMLVKPQMSKWDFFLYPYESSDWNSYVDLDPTIQFSTPAQNTRQLQETFEISVQNITSDSASIEFHWENTQVNVPIQIATQEIVMQRIEKTMNGPSFNDYFQASLYMHENNINLEQALTYIQNVTASDKALFFVVYREALILKDLKRNQEALASAKRSLALSIKAENDDFVRLNERLIKQLQ